MGTQGLRALPHSPLNLSDHITLRQSRLVHRGRGSHTLRQSRLGRRGLLLPGLLLLDPLVLRRRKPYAPRLCAPLLTPQIAIARLLVLRRRKPYAPHARCWSALGKQPSILRFEVCREGLAPGVVPWTLNSLLSRRVEPLTPDGVGK